MRLTYSINTKIFYTIGDPMRHSCICYVLNSIYDYLHLDALSIVTEVPKGKLPDLLNAAKTLGLAGLCMTTPHKQDIVDFVDECDEQAKMFRSVNYVKIENGRFIGRGLDGFGMAESILKKAGSLDGKHVLILGAGAVAGPVASELCKRGVSKISIANRTVDKAQAMADLLLTKYPEVAFDCGQLEKEYLVSIAPKADAVVQCTSLGQIGGHGDFEDLSFMEALPPHCIAAEVLYSNTSFLQAAAKKGLRMVDGIQMALNQFPEVMRFFFGESLSEEGLLEAEEAFRTAILIRDTRQQRAAENEQK